VSVAFGSDRAHVAAIIFMGLSGLISRSFQCGSAQVCRQGIPVFEAIEDQREFLLFSQDIPVGLCR